MAENFGPVMARGDKMFGNRKYSEALGCYLRAIELIKSEEDNDGDNKHDLTELYSYVSDIYYRLKNYPKMLETANESLKYSPEHRTAIALRSIANFKTGNQEESKTEMQELLNKIVFPVEKENVEELSKTDNC